MSQELLDHASFFKALSSLFESTQKVGSIWLTHKRLTHDVPGIEDPASAEYPVLVRATNGKAAEFSTRVEPGQLDRFHAEYTALLRSSMSTLRKRDKKKEKQKADEILKKKKRVAEPVVIAGPKRGAGRRKRQRQIKAAIKLEETKRRFEEREAGKTRLITTSS